MAWAIPFLNRNADAAPELSGSSFTAEQQRLDALKQGLLDRTRDEAMTAGREPNLTDYYIAALNVEELRDNPRSIFDLSRMTLDGYTIRTADIEPTPQTRDRVAAALQTAYPEGKFPGSQSHNIEIEAGQQQGVTGDTQRNLHDLDGDQLVNDFYRALQDNMRFNHTSFMNVTFHPATTLQLPVFHTAAGASFGNITLQELPPGETLTIGTGNRAAGDVRQETFNHIRVVDADNATIRINSGVRVDQLIMDHGQTRLEIEPGAHLNDLRVDAGNITLSMNSNEHALGVGTGGILNRPVFTDVVFNPASSLAGADLRGGSMDGRFNGFKNTLLDGISFDKARITGLEFRSTDPAHRSDLRNATFNGASLSDVTFSDINLSEANWEGIGSIHNVTVVRNGHATTLRSADDLHHYLGSERAQIAQEQQRAQMAQQLSALPGLSGLQQINAEQPKQVGEVYLEQTRIADQQRGAVMPVADRPLEVTQAPVGGDTVRTIVTGGEHIASVTETLHNAQSANSNVPITAEALEAKVAAAMASFSRGDGRG